MTRSKYTRRQFLKSALAGTGSVLLIGIPAIARALTAPVLSGMVLAGPSVRLNWTDGDNESLYRIRKGVDGGALAYYADVGANVLTYTDAAVLDGHTYLYQVEAKKGGQRSLSNIITLAVGAPPPPESPATGRLTLLF
jgi:hypothetical protein